MQCGHSLSYTSKPSHTQADCLPDVGNSKYTLSVILHDSLCLDLCPCTTAQVGCCDTVYVVNYCPSQYYMKSHMPRFLLLVWDPELSSQQNQRMAQRVPARMGIGG